MSDVVALERNEVQWLRQLRAHVFSAESEITALRRQLRESEQRADAFLRAWDANDPIAMAQAAHDIRMSR